MHVKGHQWPIFLYADLAYDRDDPWSGLLRNNILVAVSSYVMLQHHYSQLTCAFQAYKHVFTSPGSVDIEDPMKAPRSGNARIHGMSSVTKASIAYIATQVFRNVDSKCNTDNNKPGPIFVDLGEHLFSNRHCHGFRKFLYQYSRPP